MRIEELIGHLQSMPANADVDVYVSRNGARFVAATVEGGSAISLMLHAPEAEQSDEVQAQVEADSTAKPKRARKKAAS